MIYTYWQRINHLVHVVLHFNSVVVGRWYSSRLDDLYILTENQSPETSSYCHYNVTHSWPPHIPESSTSRGRQSIITLSSCGPGLRHPPHSGPCPSLSPKKKRKKWLSDNASYLLYRHSVCNGSNARNSWGYQLSEQNPRITEVRIVWRRVVSRSDCN
jgi:hypothetical protein